MPLQFPFTPKTIGEGYGYIFSGTTQIPSTLIDTYTCTLPLVFICLFRYSLLNNLILTSDLSIAFFSLDLNECSYNQCDSPREICVNFPGTSFCNCVAGNFLIQNSCTGGKISRIFSTNLSQEVFAKMAYNYAMRQVLFLLLLSL